MGSKSNAKKIEKLQAKINDIDKIIKQNVETKQQLMKEVEGLKADTLLNACTERRLSVDEAEKSFELFELFKKSGMNIEEISELLSPQNKDTTLNDGTLSPLDTKSSEGEKENG